MFFLLELNTMGLIRVLVNGFSQDIGEANFEICGKLCSLSFEVEGKLVTQKFELDVSIWSVSAVSTSSRPIHAEIRIFIQFDSLIHPVCSQPKGEPRSCYEGSGEGERPPSPLLFMYFYIIETVGSRYGLASSRLVFEVLRFLKFLELLRLDFQLEGRGSRFDTYARSCTDWWLLPVVLFFLRSFNFLSSQFSTDFRSEGNLRPLALMRWRRLGIWMFSSMAVRLTLVRDFHRDYVMFIWLCLVARMVPRRVLYRIGYW